MTMVTEHISGAPVVDDDNQLIRLISIGDVHRAILKNGLS